MSVVGILHEDLLFFSYSLECNLLIFIMVKNIWNRSFTEKCNILCAFHFFIHLTVFKKKIKQRWLTAPDLLCCTCTSKLVLVAWTLMFSQQCFWVCRSSGIRRCVTGWVVSDPWRWGQYINLKHQEPVMQWQHHVPEGCAYPGMVFTEQRVLLVP
jgi:hypothetical protein